MGVITGRIVGASGPTALPVPTVGQVVENVTALRALVGSVDLPAVSLLQHGAVDYEGGGLFRWDTVAGTDDSGTRLNAGGHGSSGVGWQRVYSGPVYASWFGAVGNGVADDTVALQRMIDAAMAGGRHAVLEVGQYRVTDTLTISQGIRLEGAQRPSTTGTPSVEIVWDPPVPSGTQACLLLDCSDSVLAGWVVANLILFQTASVAATGAGYGIHVKQSAAGYKPSWVQIHDCLIDAFDADPWTKGIYVEGTEATAADRPRDIFICRVRVTGTAAEDGGDWLLGGAGIHLYRVANTVLSDVLLNNSARLLIDAPADEDPANTVYVTGGMAGSLDIGFATNVYVRGGRYNAIRCDANSTSNLLEPDFVGAITLPLGGNANLLRLPDYTNGAVVSNSARYCVKTSGDTTPLEQVAAEIVKFGSAGDLRFTFGSVATIGTSNPGDAVFPQSGGVWGVNAAANGTVRIGLVGGDNNVYSGNEGAGSLVAGKYLYLAGTTSGPKVAYSAGTPEGSLLGNPGDLCVDATNGHVYIKTAGTATATNWHRVGAVGELAPGSQSFSPGQWHIQYQRLQLTGTQRLTLAGTARYIITDL